MKNSIFSLLFFLTSLTIGLYGAQPPAKILWLTNYDEAIKTAKAEGKPLFLYFTGSDWCSWCMKMDKEILSDPSFIQMVNGKLLFVKLDFPIYTQLDAKQAQQNEVLKQQFEIQGFPTVVLLDSDLRQMAILNYRSGGGKAYGEYLLKLIVEGKSLQEKMKDLNSQTSQSLEKLYQDANRLGFEQEKEKILQCGLQNEDSIFFLKEHYRKLLSAKKMGDPATRAVREKLLSLDTKNEKKIHYDVAVLDFEAMAEKLPLEEQANKAVEPLEQYLKQFGDSDHENRWRIEMTISQVYQSKNQISQALQFAKSSYEHAPLDQQESIASAVAGLQQNAEELTAQTSP